MDCIAESLDKSKMPYQPFKITGLLFSVVSVLVPTGLLIKSNIIDRIVKPFIICKTKLHIIHN